MNDIDDRIRAALHAAVDKVHENDLRPAQPPRTSTRRRHSQIRWAAPLLAAAAVLVVAAAVALSGSPSATRSTPPIAPRPSVTEAPTTEAPTTPAPHLNCVFADEGCPGTTEG